MSKKSKPMDQESLQEEYEESRIRLLMARYAEIEGEKLLKENEELSKNPFYHPSEEALQKFKKKLNRKFVFVRLKRVLLFPISYKKVFVTITALLLIFLTSVFTVEAVRIRVLNLFIQVQQEYTEIHVKENLEQISGDQLQIDWSQAYVPAKIPSSYHIINVSNNQNTKVIEYANDDHGYIIFQQKNEHSGINVDTEQADEVTYASIQGETALIVRKKDLITIAWEHQNLMFMIIGEATGLSKEEFIEIAESVTLLK